MIHRRWFLRQYVEGSTGKPTTLKRLVQRVKID